MDKTTLCVIGALTGLALPLAGAQAAPVLSPPIPAAQSFAELFEPIPNAAEKLRLADTEEMQRPARAVPADYHHHHHHHHHAYYHHHHHHHHHGPVLWFGW